MINIIKTSPSQLNDGVFANQLAEEGVPFRFGEIKSGGDTQKSIFIIDRFAVSFKEFKPTIEKHIVDNKLVPQVWHPSELSWRGLSLHRRLKLHR